ncbi:hypothetical protein XNW1_1320029 [Xenorhabdus nematophila str. Websteri]|nr:hypothetical protein XNW1_1320029 [Xenorhabdus nematophila str. Websteri]
MPGAFAAPGKRNVIWSTGSVCIENIVYLKTLWSEYFAFYSHFFRKSVCVRKPVLCHYCSG